jgi:hypothetical protein
MSAIYISFRLSGVEGIATDRAAASASKIDAENRKRRATAATSRTPIPISANATVRSSAFALARAITRSRIRTWPREAQGRRDTKLLGFGAHQGRHA